MVDRECLGDAHAPASCDNWKNWHQKIAEIKPEECKLNIVVNVWPVLSYFE